MARSRKNKASGVTMPVQVDIVSDVVCPWCWLGYRLFDKARRQSRHNIQLTWRPYMLDPDVPLDGVDYKAYMQKKFGGEQAEAGIKDRFKVMREMLEEKGPSLGIEFKFDNIKRRPNTLNAHRLIRWAQNNAEAGTDAAEHLFAAFFTNGEDIGDIAVLSLIAKEVGLDAELTAEILATEKDVNPVREEIMFFRNLGISGVPTFIYNGQFAVQGAQDPSAHSQAIEQALQTGISE